MMDRRAWCAMLAKLVAPMDAVQAVVGLVAMLPLLRGYPDAMFTEDSAVAVCKTARVLSDGVYAPITRVPTYGELEGALVRWWRDGTGWQPACADTTIKALPAPPAEPNLTPESAAYVTNLVKAFVAERTFHAERGRASSPHLKAKPVSDGVLLASYERLAAGGDKAAATRVEALKRKLELTT